MKAKTTTHTLLLLILVGFGLSACDQVKSMTGDKPKVEDVKVVETTENKTPTDTKPEDTKPEDTKPEDTKPEAKPDASPDAKTDASPDAKAPEVDEAKFINAFFEMTCVQVHVPSADKQKPIADAILARYEFTQEQYDGAKKTLSEKANVKAVLAARMKGCNKKAAEAFLTKGSGEVAEAPVKKKAAPKFYKSRRQIIRNSQIKNGKLNLNLQSNGKVSGLFSGQREGKFFNIPLSGKVDKKGNWRASGKQGTNRVTLTGTANAKGAYGKLNATINKKSYSTRVSAK